MNGNDFEFLCKSVKERSGIVLTPEKAYLVENRLSPIARRHEFGDVAALLAALRSKPEESMLREITDALTTNESFFFRDQKPFDSFREVMLPEILKERAAKKSLRIWCAAASSGQEPYSLAMILKEFAPKMPGWKIEIIGTDLSHTILKRAREGLFTQFEVQRGLPAKYLVSHFKKEGDLWVVSDELKKMINFRYFNLLEEPRSLGTFDIVFIRNVLIYFDQETKTRILNRIAKIMPNDGFLVLGAAETIIGLTDVFKPHPERSGTYIKNNAPAAVSKPGATAGASAGAAA